MGVLFSFFIPTGLGCGRGRSHRNSEVSPPKKERKKRRGVPGDTHLPRGPPPEVGSGSILGSPSSPRVGFSWRTAFRFQGEPRGPRPREALAPALLTSAVGAASRSAATSGESTRRRRQAPEPGLDFIRSPRQNLGVRPVGRGTSPVPRSPWRRERPVVTRAQPALGGLVAAGEDW